MTPNFIGSIIDIACSVIMLWYVSMLACKYKKFWFLVPFFAGAILFDMVGAFRFYHVRIALWWSFIDFVFFACYGLLVFILIRLIRKKS